MLKLLTGLCFFSAFLGRFCYLLRPLDCDAATFIYMGKMVCDGGRLCHDLVDNKFPTVGLLTSLPFRCFGICWPAWVGLETVLSMTAAWFIGRAANRIAGDSARLPAMLFAIVVLNLTGIVFGGFQLETLQVFFTSLAAAAGIEMLMQPRTRTVGWIGHRRFADPYRATGNRPVKRDIYQVDLQRFGPGQQESPAGNDATNLADGFVAGLCSGCGVMLKPTAAGVLLALMIAVVIQREKVVARLMALLAGFCVPLGVGLIYLINAGLLSDMPGLCRQIAAYAEGTVLDSAIWFKPLIVLALLGFPVLIRGWVFRRQRDPRALAIALPILCFLLLWLGIETTGVILQRRMYAYHFLPMVPPAAIIFGLLPRLVRPGQLAASLLPVVLLSGWQAGNLIATTPPASARMPVDEYLLAHAKPGDAVWMDGWPRLVLETGLRPGSRVPFAFLFLNDDRAGLVYSELILADFQRTRPAYIILPAQLHRMLEDQISLTIELSNRPLRRANLLQGWRRIETYTLDKYVRETTIGTDAVYRRR